MKCEFFFENFFPVVYGKEIEGLNRESVRGAKLKFRAIGKLPVSFQQTLELMPQSMMHQFQTRVTLLMMMLIAHDYFCCSNVSSEKKCNNKAEISREIKAASRVSRFAIFGVYHLTAS